MGYITKLNVKVYITSRKRDKKDYLEKNENKTAIKLFFFNTRNEFILLDFVRKT